MILKPADTLFKIPVRLYDPIDVQEEERIQEVSGNVARVEFDYVVGFRRIPIESILDWWESFSHGRTIADVQKYGFDVTKVRFFASGFEPDTIICDWNLTKFEKEYNKQYKKVMRHNDELKEQQIARFGEEDEITEEEIKEQLQIK